MNFNPMSPSNWGISVPARSDETITHVALVESSNGKSVAWDELVSDTQNADAVGLQPR